MMAQRNINVMRIDLNANGPAVDADHNIRSRKMDEWYDGSVSVRSLEYMIRHGVSVRDQLLLLVLGRSDHAMRT